MKRAVVLVFFILFGLSCFAVERRCEAQKLVQEEVIALQKIAQKLKKHWDISEDPCNENTTWVSHLNNNTTPRACSCDNTTCHMTTIRLKGLNLTGELPSELANLTQLRNLDLTANYLNGSIPAAWASLRLIGLYLGRNRISGPLPDKLGDMSTLQSLVVEDNQMEGPIPENLGKLTNLKTLILTGNNFSGVLPDSLANLKNMTDMRIDGNPVSGKIPYFFGNWTQLQRLDLQGTSLEGPFPPNFANLTNITELRVSDLKKGGGKFPPLRNLKGLRELVLRNLSISGHIPAYIGHMNLKVLDLSFNRLKGPVPKSFYNLRHPIDFMYLTNNMLQGTIPSWIFNSKDYIDISFNNFTGPPDTPSCQQGNVNFVSSYSSTYNNSIPTCLRRNFRCSEKPRNYNLSINCGGSKVVIGDREYEDDHLLQVGISTYTENAKWASSSTGAFLDNVNALHTATNASMLNMSNPQLYTRARLSPLSLKYYGLCLQKGPYNVSLHFAEIMFTDDQTYSSVGRRLFDVSIQGEKVLQDFDIAKEANGTGKEIIKNFTTYVDGSLEIHFYWAGKGTHSVPDKGVYGPLISAISVTPNFRPEIYEQVDTADHKLSIGAIFGIVAAPCVAILFISVGLCICWKGRHEGHNEFRALELQTSTFSLKQIKAATNSFHPSNKIGEGGFGPVYKGVLQDGLLIAVKQLSSRSKQGNREFVNEIGLISALQHPNLVKLLGCCIEGNQLLLIYEYMENNNLASALFGPKNGQLKLDWQTRRKICLGIARGLAYLHHGSTLKIVHRDIKATNILLDKDLNAKISDFGVAKLDEGNTHISTRITGTIGYMAPEYAMRGYLTDKADVYSFGVVMLEIISGRSNTNYRPKEDFTYLLDWAFVLEEQGRLIELVDPNLCSNYSKEEALQLLNLCLTCTNQSPTLRPSMSTVVRMLDGKIPMRVPSNYRANLKREDRSFNSLGNLSCDSGTHSVSMDMSSTESVSVRSFNRATLHSSSSKLLSDYSEPSTTEMEE